jgi:N-acyl-phosphatidylethanolamine-hydrolysing phospholipase D
VVVQLKIEWLGGPTFILEMGSYRLLSDPVLGDLVTLPSGDPANRIVDLPPVDIGDVDAVVLTRMSEDHFDRTAAESIDVGFRLITPADDPERVIEVGFTDIEALAWGQTFTDEKAGEVLRITAVPTSFADPPVSNGYVAVHDAGGTVQTVYWTGDTRWFNGARQVKELSDRFDVLVPYLGDVAGGSLDAKDAMQFVFLIQPKRIVPVNHQTFSHYRETIDTFRERVALTMYDKRLIELREGEAFER